MADDPQSKTTPASDMKASLSLYQRMLLNLFIATLVVLVLLALIAIADFWRPPTSRDGAVHFLRFQTLLAVALVGALGGAFSSLLRVYKFDKLPDLIADNLRFSERDLRIYTLTPLLVGAISSLVLYAIFASGLLTGDLFPSLKTLYPDTPVTAAKALFWSFVAGFAERLVQGLLNSFADAASRQAQDDRAAPKPPPAASSRAQGGRRAPANF